MPHFTQMHAQTDSQWAKVLLGFNTDPVYDIANFGCLVTAVSNLLWWITGDGGNNPISVNEWLKANNGFVPGGGIMRWPELPNVGHITAHETLSSLASVDYWLQAEDNYAILEVRTSTNGQHFVMAPLVGKIIDSEDGRLKSNKTYRFIQAHLFTATTAPVAEAPAEAPPVEVVPEVVPVPEPIETATPPVVPVDSITVPPMEFPETPYVATLYARTAGMAIDYTSRNLPIPFVAGTRFDIGSTFMVNGNAQYRTTASIRTGNWYGVDPTMFNVKLSAFQSLNLVLSQAYSLGVKFLTVLNPFKKGN